MMFLLLNLLQAQSGKLSRVVIIGAALLFIIGVALLVYFYRRYKRVEKESEEDWDSSRRSLFVNVSPPAPKSEAALVDSASVNADGLPVPEELPVAGVAALESKSEIETPSPSPATLAVPPEPSIEPRLPQEPVTSSSPEYRPTEILASPSPIAPVGKTEVPEEPPAFDDDIWSGLDVGEQPPIAPADLSKQAPSPTEIPREARVDERSHREPFEPPRVERIVHREPYESPRIEPLAPREQTATRESMQPPPAQKSSESSGRVTTLFGSAEPPSSASRPIAPAQFPEVSVPAGVAPRTYRAPAGSVLGLPAEPSNQPLILGEPVRPASETGIGALTNYGKDLEPKSGRAGTVALLLVGILLGTAVALYLFVPSIHSRVTDFVARVRGTDVLAAREAALKPRAQIIPSYRPEVKENMVTARGAVDNISDQPLENLSIEVSLQRVGDAPPDIRNVSVTPNPLGPGERGTFEFEYDGKRGTGFAGYKITRLFSNGTEVKFRTPGQK